MYKKSLEVRFELRFRLLFLAIVTKSLAVNCDKLLKTDVTDGLEELDEELEEDEEELDEFEELDEELESEELDVFDELSVLVLDDVLLSLVLFFDVQLTALATTIPPTAINPKLPSNIFAFFCIMKIPFFNLLIYFS